MNSACDIGCDEYGYPIRVAGEETIVGRSPSATYVGIFDVFDPILAKYELRIATHAVRQPLSASWHHLACITAPPPRTMPARALFCRTQKIGIR